ncbi:MAG: PilZ domain-containing protein [Proteobacteria bacterium]|nr:PilZ domain-containing protein [Pseudomonadota bacterium]
MDENRRNFSRVKFNSKAYLNYNNSHEQVDLVDISLKGALVSFQNPMDIGSDSPCTFELHLSDSEIVMNISAIIVYKRDDNLGLKFDNIDLESMIHLRRLVELNVGNPDQIQKELFFLVSPTK